MPTVLDLICEPPFSLAQSNGRNQTVKKIKRKKRFLNQIFFEIMH